MSKQPARSSKAYSWSSRTSLNSNTSNRSNKSGSNRSSSNRSSPRAGTPESSKRRSNRNAPSDNEQDTSNNVNEPKGSQSEQRKKIKDVQIYNYELDSDSGSDEGLSNEAKRIMKRRKKEQDRLKRLGSLVPIDTDTDLDNIRLAESSSTAAPIPPRPKRVEMSLQTITLSDVDITGVASQDLRRRSILFDPYAARVSKSVTFGTVCEGEVVGSIRSSAASSVTDHSELRSNSFSGLTSYDRGAGLNTSAAYDEITDELFKEMRNLLDQEEENEKS